MSKMIKNCEYIVIDVQHNTKMGIEFHCLNVCYFNESIEKTITLCRCLINGLSSKHYHDAFTYMFDTMA